MTTEVLAPKKIVSTRWRCPFCPRSRSSKTAITEHMGRCWYNPEVRSCKTCVNYDPGSSGCGEYRCNCMSDECCMAGVDLNSSEPHSALPIGCAKWEAIF